MIVDKAGEIIADILTISPSLSGIPSASAILDTSNFTFQAISYGKDALSFSKHAHVSVSSPYPNDIILISYSNTANYKTSSEAVFQFYNLDPQAPMPMDTRLEMKSTSSLTGSGLDDFGQCINSVILSSLSSVSRTVGCFAPSSGRTYRIAAASAIKYENGIAKVDQFLFTSSISGTYNRLGIMDGSGFLTFAPFNIAQGRNAVLTLGAAAYASGAVIYGDSSFSSAGKISVIWTLSAADAASLLMYGGIYHIGLWCLDVKAMLKEGYKPPFSFNALNNIRKYRLFAKKTFLKDLLYCENPGGQPSNILFYQPGYATPVDTTYNWMIGFI
jgi:hypothetical protein